jgi:hypothetical protein
MASPGGQPQRGPLTLWLAPPSPDADRRTRLRFVRDINVRCLVAAVPVTVVALVLGSGALGVVVLAVSILQLLNIAWLEVKLRRL